MSKLPSLKPAKVIKILQKNGFVIDHQSGSHVVLINFSQRRRTVVSLHNKDLKKGALLSIIKESGLSRETFIRG